MLQVLVESRAASARRTSWTAVSVVVHLAVLGAAVALTATDAPETRQRDDVEHIVYTAPSSVRASRAAPLSAVAPLAISPPTFIVPSITAPIALPVLASDPFSHVIEDLRSIGSSLVGTRHGNSDAPGGVHTAENVDRIVEPLPGNPPPAYPARLSGARVEGEVLVRFVVDTAGRVEARTIEIAQASHALFGESVKQWLGRTRYSPALVNGRAVRQLVQQRIAFTLMR